MSSAVPHCLVPHCGVEHGEHGAPTIVMATALPGEPSCSVAPSTHPETARERHKLPPRWCWRMFVTATLSLCLFGGGCQEELFPEQALLGGNAYLTNSIDRSIKATISESEPHQYCVRPNRGFTVHGCVVARSPEPMPVCTRKAYFDGRCRAVELRESLLEDKRVIAIMEEASREFCSYAGPPGPHGSDGDFVIGCGGPPHPDWRLVRRSAPLTICVIGLGDGDAEQRLLRYALRDGRRANDAWCDQF